jgi:CubicO group peptidase (beta-lactamase class C family)
VTNRIVAFLLVCLAVLSRAAYGLDLQPKFDAPARLLIEDRAAVGFSVGVFKDGQTEVLGYGETKKGSGVAPNADTVYEIGSITKVFTAVLLADMMRRGSVKLDAPVQDYLPASVKVPVFAGQPIRLLHLVTHTSGLPRDPENMWPVDRQNPFADYSVKQLYDFLNSYRLRRAPGEYEYSNLGMGLLGHVLTLKAGESYEQLLLERVCEPLGMRDTRPHPSADMLARLAPPYDEHLWRVENWDLTTLAGAGGIRSTVHDMLIFIRANLTAADTPISSAIQMSHDKRYTMKDGRGVALAWHITADGTTLVHDGTTGGYRAYLAIVPSRNVGIVVLANTRNDRIPQLGRKLLQLTIDESKSSLPERNATTEAR